MDRPGEHLPWCDDLECVGDGACFDPGEEDCECPGCATANMPPPWANDQSDLTSELVMQEITKPSEQPKIVPTGNVISDMETVLRVVAESRKDKSCIVSRIRQHVGTHSFNTLESSDGRDLLLEAVDEIERLREWGDIAFHLINRIKPTNAQDANDQAGLLTAYPKEVGYD